MSYLSPFFVVFLIAVLMVYYLIPAHARYIWLLAASICFYYCLNKEAILYMICFIIYTFVVGIILDRLQNANFRKFTFVLSVISIVVYLVITKYWLFIITNINRIISKIGSGNTLSIADILVPIGISYFTLSSIGYLVDVYVRKSNAEKNILKYALFLMFFPIVTAGPIERSNNFLIQINNPKECTYDNVKNGLILVAWGFYKKIVIADTISKYVNDMFNNYNSYGSFSLVLGTFLFSIILYADFSGYSDIAVGIGEAFGFKLTRNFYQPYFAQGIRDFWKRWHISFSSWLRDYIYIPLGGNKKGTVRKQINIFIVFLISGIWHGSSWNFILWGGLHGLFYIIEEISNRIRNIRDDQNQELFGVCFFKALKTFFIVCIAWFFFKMDNTMVMIDTIKHMCGNWTNMECGITLTQLRVWCLSLVPLLAVDLAHERKIEIRALLERQPWYFRWMVYLTASFVIVIAYLRNYGQGASAFLYTQF